MFWESPSNRNLALLCAYWWIYLLISSMVRRFADFRESSVKNKHTIWLKVNSPCRSLLLSSIGGQSPASSFLVPSLAVRYGLLFKRDPSYSFGFGQVGRGTLFIHGLLIWVPKKGDGVSLPAWCETSLLAHQLRHLRQLVKSLFLDQGKPYTEQLVYTCSHNFSPTKWVCMCRTLT